MRRVESDIAVGEDRLVSPPATAEDLSSAASRLREDEAALAEMGGKLSEAESIRAQLTPEQTADLDAFIGRFQAAKERRPTLVEELEARATTMEAFSAANQATSVLLDELEAKSAKVGISKISQQRTPESAA